VAKSLLLDTDVLIDLNRLRPEAVDYIARIAVRPLVSAVTVVELYAGVREGRERDDLDAFIAQSNVAAIDAHIAEEAGLIFRRYRKSHGTGLADAIIAATCIAEGATLVTMNVRHFPMLSDIVVPYTK
jgi:predicted nucleic acid-binding protein